MTDKKQGKKMRQNRVMEKLSSRFLANSIGKNNNIHPATKLSTRMHRTARAAFAACAPRTASSPCQRGSPTSINQDWVAKSPNNISDSRLPTPKGKGY
jgi:hypothetical protein